MEINDWESTLGILFLRRMGLRAGQCVLDFGCRTGEYALPAAKIAGDKGRVWAVDKNQEALDELADKAAQQDLGNIELVNNNGGFELDLPRNGVDMILIYDVLHIFNRKERGKLLRNFYKLMNSESVLSVHPKHTIDDMPGQEFASLSKKEVVAEICSYGFEKRGEYLGRLNHDRSLVEGKVFNFKVSSPA